MSLTALDERISNLLEHRDGINYSVPSILLLTSNLSEKLTSKERKWVDKNGAHAADNFHAIVHKKGTVLDPPGRPGGCRPPPPRRGSRSGHVAVVPEHAAVAARWVPGVGGDAGLGAPLLTRVSRGVAEVVAEPVIAVDIAPGRSVVSAESYHMQNF